MIKSEKKKSQYMFSLSSLDWSFSILLCSDIADLSFILEEKKTHKLKCKQDWFKTGFNFNWEQQGSLDPVVDRSI